MNKKLLPYLFLFLSAIILPAKAQENATPTSSTNVALWPTMRYADFMPTHPDQSKREKMWNYFLIVEQEAKRFAGSEDHWVMLKTVRLGTRGPMWFSGSSIELNAESVPVTMFHEIFHNTFNGSQFQKGADNEWGEAFCDAFAYMMEKKFMPPPRTEWFLHMDRSITDSYSQIIAREFDKGFVKKHFYPACLIIRRSGKDPERFRDLWFKLQKLRQEKNADVLNAFFGYAMEHGKPL